MKISRLVSGGMITNYHCSSACTHCLYNCSQKRSRKYILYSEAKYVFAKIRALGCHSVHIGGGEPLLEPEKLFDALRAAQECFVSIDYVETNSSWFKSEDESAWIVKRLLELGVDTLLVSISPFHNEFIPFKKVKGVIKLCDSMGMNVFPWLGEFYREMNSLDPAVTHSLEEYEFVFGKGFIRKLEERYHLTMKGRALRTFAEYHERVTLKELLCDYAVMPCSELLNVSHFHVDCYCNYIPPQCTGLSVAVHDLDRELSPEDYPFITLLYEKGITALYKLAVEKYGYSPEHDAYVSKCELCTEIREFLVNTKGVRTKDLAPVEFYM